LRSNLIKGGER